MTVSADSLHLLAHQAQLSARTEDDWWDNALDTALAAVNATRHPRAFREQGEAAVERMRRWNRDGSPRRVSADVAALALAARAAADLARRDRDLEMAAREAAADLAGRRGVSAPSLHLALTAWAMDRLVTSRDSSPWPEIRAHLAHNPMVGSGVEGPLRIFAAAVASPSFDAGKLVRELLSGLPASPGAEDSVVLLWVVTMAIERCTPQMDHADSGLQTLIDRRGELALRLAHETSSRSFEAPVVSDFDPDAELDLRPVTYVSPTEALLIDISLASAESETPWLTFEEAEALFGGIARDVERRLVRRTSMLCLVLGLAVGGLFGVVAAWIGLALDVAVPFAIAIGVAIWVAAASVAHHSNPRPVTQAIGMFLMGLALTACVYAVNSIPARPILPDVAGFVVGALVGLLAAVAWSAALTVWQRRS